MLIADQGIDKARTHVLNVVNYFVIVSLISSILLGKSELLL